MKKIILLIAVSISFSVFTQAQTISKSDAQKISKEINSNLESIDKALVNADWKEVQKVFDKTATILENNAEGMAQIFENVNFTKLIMTMAKLQTAVDQKVDVKGMEESITKISQRFEKAMTNIMEETK